MTIAILATLALTGILIFVISRIGSLNRGLDKYDPKIHPELDGGIYDIDLDDTFRFCNVLKLTWKYFDSHPMDDELTELHYATRKGEDIACQICRQKGENGSPEILLLFSLAEDMPLPPYLQDQSGNPYEVILSGNDQRDKAAETIKEVLGITDSTKVPYQLAGTQGPCFYFSRIDKNTGAIEFKVPNDKNDRRLCHIFELTWAYFSEHPHTREFTEVHTAPAFFQIFSDGALEQPKYLLIISLNPGTDVPEGLDPAEDVHRLTFEGENAACQLEDAVYQKLGLTPDYRALYELTSMNGPEKFFEFGQEEEEC